MRFYMGMVGTADRRWTAGAGLHGFRPHADSWEDAMLFAKLRQYPWQPSDRRLGNYGGHFGTYQTEYLRRCIVPLFGQ